MVKNPSEDKAKVKEIPMDKALVGLINHLNVEINNFNSIDLGPFDNFKVEAFKKLIEAKGWMTQALFVYNAQVENEKRKKGEGNDAAAEVPPVPEKTG